MVVVAEGWAAGFVPPHPVSASPEITVIPKAQLRMRFLRSVIADHRARSLVDSVEVPSVMGTAGPGPVAPIATPAARIVDGTKIYGKGATLVRALDKVSVEFRASEFTAIRGPSGSGKSTLLHCMASRGMKGAG